MLLTNQGKLMTAMAVIAVFAIGFIAHGQETKTPQAKGGKADVVQNNGVGAKVASAKLGDKIGEAIALREDIEARQDKLVKVLELAAQLNARTKDVKSADETRESIAKALDEYIEIVGEFKKLRRAATVAIPLLKKNLDAAEPTFNRAAEEYGAKAKAMRFPANQQRYAAMAEEARKDAAEFGKDRQEFEAKVALLFELLDLVEESGHLAADMKSHLSLHRDAAKARLVNDLISTVARQQQRFDGLYQGWKEHLDRRRGLVPPSPGVDPAFPPPGVFPPGVFPEPPAKK